MALAAYRGILRSARIAFQGDIRLLPAARGHARKEFEAKRLLAPDSAEARSSIAHAEEVARVLRHNVVQGIRNEEEATGSYTLRIHEDIERGDNESIKAGRGMEGMAKGQCCGGQ